VAQHFTLLFSMLPPEIQQFVALGVSLLLSCLAFCMSFLSRAMLVRWVLKNQFNIRRWIMFGNFEMQVQAEELRESTGNPHAGYFGYESDREFWEDVDAGCIPNEVVDLAATAENLGCVASEFAESVAFGECDTPGYQSDPHDNIFLEAESHFSLDY
jgi:hypothetical protein